MKSICSAVTMRKKILRLRESEMSAWLSTRRRRKERSSLLPSPLSLWMSSLGVCLNLNLYIEGFTNNDLDDETDMKALEAAVRGIEKDGLVWGASKLVPVGFGIKKLQINLVIEDDKIGLDDLQEEIQEFEDHVQSTDIVSSLSAPPFGTTLTLFSLPCKSCRELLVFRPFLIPRNRQHS
jgi:translation elongation factor EF-1beta